MSTLAGMAEIKQVTYDVSLTEREKIALCDLMNRYLDADRRAAGTDDHVSIEVLGNEESAAIASVFHTFVRERG